jgi:hypothetical protein
MLGRADAAIQIGSTATNQWWSIGQRQAVAVLPDDQPAVELPLEDPEIVATTNHRDGKISATA